MSRSCHSVVLYKRLLSRMLPYWPMLLFGLFGTMIGSGVDAGFTWFLKPLLNHGFIDRNGQFIAYLPHLILMGFLIRGLAGFLADYFLSWVGRKIVSDFRAQLFAKYLKLPTSAYDVSTAGHLLSVLLYNVEQVAKVSTNTLLIIVRESCFVIGLLTVMLVNSWRLTLLFALTVPIIGLIVIYTSRRMRRLSRTIQAGMGNITHMAEEALEGHQVIKIFGRQACERDKFNQAIQDNRHREMKVVISDSLGTCSVQIVASVAIAVTIYLATSPTVYGISAGAFISMIAAMLAILKPMKTLTTVNSVIQRGLAASEDIFKNLDADEERAGGEQIVSFQGEIAYRDVEFQYAQGKQRILKGINFVVKPGQTIALVGRSGSGKSTLVNLLPRFYELVQGQICLDGTDIKTLKLGELRRCISVVSQRVTLFNDTIKQNIAYGCLDRPTGFQDEKDILKAAEAANLMSFIQKLPDGLETVIGGNGVLLSGGQRQRLAIARALLKNAPILILDEATSALDTESERHIQEALQRLIQNRTTLVIAHRLSTIENADCILVLEKGEIIESGDHKTLIRQNSVYAKLHAMQFRDAEHS